MKIILIEDDSTISFAVKTFLKRHELETDVFTSLKATTDIDLNQYDLMILDVNLPDGSGFDYLKYIRTFSDIPVIMLTVKDAEEYVLKGFSEGADEYMTKPFSLPILKARIDNVLKRKNDRQEKMAYQELELDTQSKTAKVEGLNIELNRQEFAVLEILLENQDANLIRERIIDMVWGSDLYEVNDNTLTVTIKRLRSKLGKYGVHIKTVRGIGYSWDSGANENR
ncbi:MAG: response regulator transcription factor [Eubacteriaceae bacterium]|jgi:DNA-binding response OmpR family regulator|nr:response regulator transcription factor [Eubacteriaceae bacterium]